MEPGIHGDYLMSTGIRNPTRIFSVLLYHGITINSRCNCIHPTMPTSPGASNVPGPGPFVPGILVSEFIGRCVAQGGLPVEGSIQIIMFLVQC